MMYHDNYINQYQHVEPAFDRRGAVVTHVEIAQEVANYECVETNSDEVNINASTTEAIIYKDIVNNNTSNNTENNFEINKADNPYNIPVIIADNGDIVKESNTIPISPQVLQT